MLRFGSHKSDFADVEDASVKSWEKSFCQCWLCSSVGIGLLKCCHADSQGDQSSLGVATVGERSSHVERWQQQQ